MKILLNKDVKEESLDEVTVTKFEWIRDIHMFYVQDPNKTMNVILRQLTNLNEDELIELDRFSQRLKSVFDRVYEKKVRKYLLSF